MSDKDDGELRGWEVAVLLLLSPGLIALETITCGFAMSMVWKWFVVPLGVSPIGIVHAVGLSVLLCLMRPSVSTDHLAKKKGYQAAVHALSQAVLRITFTPAFALAMGYVLHRINN